MEKKTLVVLHGWGSGPARWEKVKALLEEKGVAVEIPTILGFDAEKPTPHPLTMADYINWLDGYVNSLKSDHITLCGHSHGARIAIAYVGQKKPKKVAKLVLIDSAGIPPRNTIKRIFFKILTIIGKLLLKPIKNTALYTLFQRIIYKLAREHDYISSTPVQKETMKNMLIYSAVDDCQHINIPTVCLWGENDISTPLWMGKEIARLIPHCRLYTLPTGHNPHQESPDKLVELVFNFL